MIVDAAILRVILYILSGLLLLGIYLWERTVQDEEAQGETGWPDTGTKLMEGPPLSTLDTSRLQRVAHQDEGANNAAVTLPDYNSETLDAKATSKGSRTLPIKSGPQVTEQNSSPSEPSEDEKDDYWHTGVPGFILQLIISAKNGGRFNGTDVLRAFHKAGLVADENGVFYLKGEVNDQQEVALFSVASMVKPGSFPIQKMEEFKTPGLTMFSQLPGSTDGITLFSTMLASARIIAKELGGEIQDETHSRLTNQTTKHIQSQIIEYQRQTRLTTRRGR